jgi:hypothetical protein
MNRPSRRDINNILNCDIFGYNDKRIGYNRIKLVERLTRSEVALLESELPKMYPTFKFVIEEFNWRPSGYSTSRGRIVTTIKYCEI